ncbi:hypothetical protein CRG98_035305 [Punica granatum]|uniref:DYW domain-containing protein n=1 Tax=Punica granatum TaxID=22663 RepID=A0A2I0IJN3_PUNGR|nr:hypothetical protein CRG98_035305 [Punica granatum]
MMMPKCSHNLPTPIALTKQSAAALLRSCSGSPDQLKQLHSVLLTTGLSVKNSLLTGLLVALINLGDFRYARKLFDGMHKPRVFLWNTLIRGYSKNEMPVESVSLYKQMASLGVRPDEFTHPFVLKACSDLPEPWAGCAVHAHVVKHGLEFFTEVRNELMIMCAKFGDVGSADYLFGSMIERDLVAWNAFIATCVQVGHASRALTLFREMGPAGIRPDAVTVVGVLSACGQLGCLETGEKIYEYARSEGIVIGSSNMIVENARLDMYMKCGSTGKARSLFNQMPHRNVITWSTMIVGYATNGDSEQALALFSKMQNSGPSPNHVTYLGALLACAHAGLVEQGRAFFNAMVRSRSKDIQPRKEHYACMVDMLGRAGNLEEAYEFITSMPTEPDSGVWGALLGACAIHKNVKLGQVAADKLFLLAPEVASYQVLLSNMYASGGRWGSVDRLRLRIRKKGIKKVMGYSTVEFNGEIHVFYRGDRSHPQARNIYQKLEELYAKMKGFGYIQEVGSVYHDVEVEEKEAMTSVHSEKLAIAFTLVINEVPESPIRVIKNLRTCEDCHNFCKFVSRISMREIVMRDKSRFHHFRDGTCSCKDFW